MTIPFQSAKFNIGELVCHKTQGYRAVIIDIDPIFQASGKVNPQAPKRLFTQKNPWYRLLVDGTSQMTYVEECHLEKDLAPILIDNPLIPDFLKETKETYGRKEKGH
jgi:heat shock protein HspQ